MSKTQLFQRFDKLTDTHVKFYNLLLSQYWLPQLQYWRNTRKLPVLALLLDDNLGLILDNNIRLDRYHMYIRRSFLFSSSSGQIKSTVPSRGELKPTEHTED